MITSNFFPKDNNQDLVKNVGTFEFTKEFAPAKTAPGTTYIDNNDTPFIDAYWLGWIRPENTPTAFKMSARQYNSISDTINSYDSTIVQNYNVTYMVSRFSSDDYWHKQSGAIYKYKNTSESITEKWKAAPEAQQFALRTKRLLNNFYIGTVNFSSLCVCYSAFQRGDHATTAGWSLYNTIVEINAEDFETWKTGTQTITIDGQTVSVNNQNLIDNYYDTVTVNNNVYDVAITAYTAIEDDCKDSNNTTFRNFHLFPAIDLYATGQASTVQPIDTPYEIIFATLGSSYIRYESENYMKTFDSDRNCNRITGTGGGTNNTCQEIIDRNSGVSDLLSVLPGGYVFTFESSSHIQEQSQIHGVPYGYYIFDNCVMWLISGNAWYTRMYKPDDIIKHMALMPRWKARRTDAPSYGVVDGVYYSEVLDSGEFTGRLITGTRTELMHKLQIWQYESIAENQYKGENLPPYEPPIDEDADIVGESVTPPNIVGIGGTGGFVTHYVLTPKQMARLGGKLWAGVADTDFWDSIAVVLDNTLSINPADILKYIVAVRQYPMKLSDSNACSVTVHTDMYIGRGGYGLEIASLSDPTGYTTLAMMNRPVSLEYGGYLDVPTYYNDFRDYEPCTRITLHVPFCGSCELIPSQVVGKQLIMQYSIDYTSGAITAICNVRGDGLTYPVAKLSGQIGANVQLSASETMDNLQNIAAVGAGIAAFAVNPGAGTALLASQGVATSLSNNRANPYSTGRSGGFSAFFEPRVPYLLILHDKYIKPDDYAHIYGNPVNCMKTLSDLHGYTECENVDVTGLTCTADDAAIIKRLLESGVYID